MVRSPLFTAATLTAMLLSMTGCEQVRKVTYPQDFQYMEDREVKQIMQKMGENMGKLAQLVDDESLPEKEKQEKVIDVLNKLDGYATKLSGGHKQTNQFVIAEHIHGFSGDLVNAKMLASLDPPRYDKTRNIVNSCSKCHEYR
jgi:hypothetical protein